MKKTALGTQQEKSTRTINEFLLSILKHAQACFREHYSFTANKIYTKSYAVITEISLLKVTKHYFLRSLQQQRHIHIIIFTLLTLELRATSYPSIISANPSNTHKSQTDGLNTRCSGFKREYTSQFNLCNSRRKPHSPPTTKGWHRPRQCLQGPKTCVSSTAKDA